MLNKADRLPAEEHDAARVLGARLLADAGQSALTPAVLVSGLTGEGLSRLFDRDRRVVPFDAWKLYDFEYRFVTAPLSLCCMQRGRVRAEDYDGNLCEMEVDAPESLRRRLRRYLVGNSTPSVENSVYK